MSETRNLIREQLDEPSEILEGEEFWVLQETGTDETIMAFHNGVKTGPITFATEEQAIEFAVKYNVPNKMVPTFFKMKKNLH